MPVSDQGVSLDRYMLIPRVLVFVTRDQEVLLLRGGNSKRLWAGRYNGIGGHLEPGEDALSAARRELLEEAGIQAELRLVGTLVVDTGQNPGVGIYIFTGQSCAGSLRPSREGTPKWIAWEQVRDLPVVEDLPVLLERVRAAGPISLPFSAHSCYDAAGKLVVRFA
jgi:8-oxo-dGTP diphosphatase